MPASRYDPVDAHRFRVTLSCTNQPANRVETMTFDDTANLFRIKPKKREPTNNKEAAIVKYLASGFSVKEVVTAVSNITEFEPTPFSLRITALFVNNTTTQRKGLSVFQVADSSPQGDKTPPIGYRSRLLQRKLIGHDHPPGGFVA
jgi:hypothetical protein